MPTQHRKYERGKHDLSFLLTKSVLMEDYWMSKNIVDINCYFYETNLCLVIDVVFRLKACGTFYNNDSDIFFIQY